MFANKKMDIYNHILQSKKRSHKLFAVLIDPDKQSEKTLINILNKANKAKIDFFFVGGSLMTDNNLNECISLIRKNSSVPVILFPGNSMQVTNQAHGILLLSLIQVYLLIK